MEYPKPLPVEQRGEHWWMECDGHELRLSNLPKVFWPVEGYTKGDLIAYYYNIAPTMLPYLAGRPLTMKRMPNGIAQSFFYEKDAPVHTPDWMPRCPVQSSDSDRWERPKHDVINYLMVEDTAGLLFMANLGCVEFHPLHSRCSSIRAPRLPVLRPRPVRAGRVPRGPGRGRPGPGGLRAARPHRVPQDLGGDRDADLRPDHRRRMTTTTRGRWSAPWGP